MNVSSSEIIENNNSKTLNRVSTKDEWALVNPILQFGELGFEIDGQMTNIKIGNGVTHWNALPYISKQCPYDVGDIFYTENETHPSVRWPGTEWEALPGGHCLVAAGTNPETGTIFQAGETGGEEKHQLTIGELASHSHVQNFYHESLDGVRPMGRSDGVNGAGSPKFFRGIETLSTSLSVNTDSTGNNKAHNNLPPFISVFCWIRIS